MPVTGHRHRGSRGRHRPCAAPALQYPLLDARRQHRGTAKTPHCPWAPPELQYPLLAARRQHHTKPRAPSAPRGDKGLAPRPALSRPQPPPPYGGVGGAQASPFSAPAPAHSPRSHSHCLATKKHPSGSSISVRCTRQLAEGCWPFLSAPLTPGPSRGKQHREPGQYLCLGSAFLPPE